MRNGARFLCDALAEYGARVVFGVPGTQNVELFEALRRSHLRVVLTTSELTAAFMAGAYARVSGEVGVVVTIPGPGFALALPGLAEAFLDSAAVVHITAPPSRHATRRFQLQALEQRAMAQPVAKGVRQVTAIEELADTLAECWGTASSGEPGPIVVEIAAEAISASAEHLRAVSPTRAASRSDLRPLVERLKRANRPVVYAGQGALRAASELQQLAERWRTPVATTPSARGIVPEDHPLALGFDPLRSDVGILNELCEKADLVLAIGCKFSHNGSAGFGLRLAGDALVHVDASAEVLNANYPASMAIQCDAKTAIAALVDDPPSTAAWSVQDIALWREKIRALPPPGLPEPRIASGATAPSDLFAALRRTLPRDAVLVTDSGLHQILARRYYDVLAPGGLLLPSDFQSMGFGVPAAIGATFAAGNRPVVAIVGDGGLTITGTELLTAAREQIDVMIVVFNDGYLNQIRYQQLREYGHTIAVTLGPLNLEAFAGAVGAAYVELGDDAEAAFRTALATPGPVIVDVPIGDSTAVRLRGARSAAREAARDALGFGVLKWIKRLKG